MARKDEDSFPAPAESSVTDLAAKRRERVERIVDAWMRERIHGSILARETPAYNHLVAELGDLKRRLIED
ncbi:MAG: hypothetical protein QJR02_10145 [Sinobacteraceae bacterium]|nr:hypothetical protein [Nevskiaceae bacterium]